MDYQCNEKFGNFLGNRIGNLPIDIKANLLISNKTTTVDYHKISYFLVSFDTLIVGVAGLTTFLYHTVKQTITLFILIMHT
tara:strand:- start:170 stop:412 length:243 start_codon:yes stop_codon:yes gene_type:complete